MKSLLIYLLLLMTTIIVVNTSCQKELSQEGLSQSNNIPVANAGSDIVLQLPLDSIMLSGVLSTDTDGNISEWLWTKISGPASFSLSTPNTEITKFKNLVAGIYEIELKVTDNKSAFSFDTIMVTVNNPTQVNRPPVADAGTGQTITLPINLVNVDGSGSTDPDGNITQWIWTRISGPASFQIASAYTVQTQITSLVEGSYQFELKVTDGGGLFSKDTLNINVLPSLPASNLDFYFADPTGSLDAANMTTITFSPRLDLVIVKIANYPDGIIRGVWRNNYTPMACPLIGDYHSNEDTHTSFLLPPGTYNWVAESVITSFNGYPLVPDGLKQFMATRHTTQGTITIPAGNSCTVKKIVF